MGNTLTQWSSVAVLLKRKLLSQSSSAVGVERESHVNQCNVSKGGEVNR